MCPRLWVAAWRDFGVGRGALVLSSSIAVSDTSGAELLLLPGLLQTMPEKTEFSTSRFSGSAFGWSSFPTFVSRRSLEFRWAPPVNPACAAPRGSLIKSAPCSLPRPSGLRSAPGIDSASLRSFPRQL